jgi:hypothetical protein
MNNNSKRIKNLLKDNIKDITEVDDIPMCDNCLYEIEEGCYICLNCKINLCPNHAFEHIKKKNLNHELIFLIKNK